MFNWFKKKEEVVTETVVVLNIYFNAPNGDWTSWSTTDLINPYDEFIYWYTEEDSKYFILENKDSADKDVIRRDTIARVEIRQEERVVVGKINAPNL